GMPVDVRVVAATNRDLEAEVQSGRFREDLFFRLQVFPIHVPSLDERREDIPLLVAHLLERHCQLLKRRISEVSAAAMIELETRTYRGNVRELSNLIERALLLSDPGEAILPEHLFDGVLQEIGSGPITEAASGDRVDRGLYDAVAEFEKTLIVSRLELHG